MNFNVQYYKGIPLKLIDRSYADKKAKRFVIIPSSHKYMNNQNVWIPNRHLDDDGTILSDENIDYVFLGAQVQLAYAGYMLGFVPIEV